MSSIDSTAAPRPTTSDDLLDASVAPGPQATKGRPAWFGIAAAMVFPLFFVVMFSLCYISAFHSPKPNDAPLYIVGSSEQTSAVVAGIDKQADGAFDLKTTASVAVAEHAVKNREAIGAIQLGSPLHAYVASGNGPITASTVTQIATTIQAQERAAGSTVELTTTELAPVAPGDSVGTGLFYFFIICTIGGYLTVTILAQVGGALRLRGRYFTVLIASILVPPITFALSSIFIGDYGLGAGHVFGLLGIGAFYTFTVGAISLLANQLAGRAAIFLVMTLNIFVNFPSAGGAIPATFLPGFWQGVHSFWFGAGSMDAIRDLVYFNGAGGMWVSLSHTAIWLLAALALSAVLGIRKGPIAPEATRATAGTEADRQHHRHVEGARSEDATDDRKLADV